MLPIVSQEQSTLCFAEIFQEYKISNSPLMIYPGNDNVFKVDYTLCEIDEDCYPCHYR